MSKRLCIDCKHFYGGESDAWCKRPNPLVGYVTLRVTVTCIDERHTTDNGRCGYDADYFEPKPVPKPSFFSRFFR